MNKDNSENDGLDENTILKVFNGYKSEKLRAEKEIDETRNAAAQVF